MGTKRIKVEVHPQRLQKTFRELAQNKALGSWMSSEAIRGMDPYVPYRGGMLSESATISKPFFVTYSTPYANRVYQGKGMKIHKDNTPGHPKATKQWDKKWWKEHREDYCRSVEAYIERVL